MMYSASPVSAKEEEVKVLSAGKQISVYLFIPDGRPKYPVVLVLHGVGKPQDVFCFARALQHRGIAAAVVEYYDAQPGPTPRYMIPWLRACEDTITYLQRQPWVDDNRIGVAGGSLGAILACVVAAADKRVRALVEIAGYMPPWSKTEKMPPTLILHGSEDKVISVKGAYMLASLLKRTHSIGEMEIYPHVGHDIFGTKSDDVTQKMVYFFERYLK